MRGMRCKVHLDRGGMCDNVQNVLANRRSIENRGMPHPHLAALEEKIMQSDQHITHLPAPFLNTKRTSDNDGHDAAAETSGNEKHKDSPDRRDADKPAIGRRPARSNENTPKRQR